MTPPKHVSGAIAKLDKHRHKGRDPAEKDVVAPIPEEEEPATGDAARVLETISLCQTTLTSKIEEVKIDIG